MKRLFLALLASAAFALSTHAVTNIVTIANFTFTPNSVAINSGDTVLWTNTTFATTSHDVTRTNVPFQWNSGILNSTKRSYSILFTNAGSYFYFCNTHVYSMTTPHPEQTGSVSVVSANLSPTVGLTNPLNNARFRAPANFTLQASATDSDGTITNVQFFLGATSLGNDTTAPYSFNLVNLPASNYTFTAVARDNGGLSATSAVVNVFVQTNAILSAPQRLPNGQFTFTLTGIAGQTYATESSINLTNWSAILTNLAPANTFNITDSTSTNILLRYYRARQDL